MATKKSSAIKKVSPRGSDVKRSIAAKSQTMAELRHGLADSTRQLQDCQRQLTEALQRESATASENLRLLQELKELLEQQTATSEILGVIASSSTNIQPVLDVVAENAARLCDALDAVVYRVVGSGLRVVAKYGSIPPPIESLPITRGLPTGRAVVDRKTIHIHDVAAETQTEFQDSKAIQQITGTRTILATPLLREGVAIGAISIAVQRFVRFQTDILDC